VASNGQSGFEGDAGSSRALRSPTPDPRNQFVKVPIALQAHLAELARQPEAIIRLVSTASSSIRGPSSRTDVEAGTVDRGFIFAAAHDECRAHVVDGGRSRAEIRRSTTADSARLSASRKKVRDEARRIFDRPI